MVVLTLRLVGKCILRAEWENLRAKLLALDSMITEGRILVVPLVVQKLAISAEDHRHARHKGFDTRAICRAIWRRLFNGRREGASTIEQQIVRVLTNRFEVTLWRKVREIVLATLITDVVPKSAMPQLYVSIGYFGWRMNGFGEACRRLHLKPSTMSFDDAAALVARLKYPEPRFAGNERSAQIHRRREHLKRLYRRHLIDGTYRYLTIRDEIEAARNRHPYSQATQSVS